MWSELFGKGPLGCGFLAFLAGTIFTEVVIVLLLRPVLFEHDDPHGVGFFLSLVATVVLPLAFGFFFGLLGFIGSRRNIKKH